MIKLPHVFAALDTATVLNSFRLLMEDALARMRGSLEISQKMAADPKFVNNPVAHQRVQEYQAGIERVEKIIDMTRQAREDLSTRRDLIRLAREQENYWIGLTQTTGTLAELTDKTQRKLFQAEADFWGLLARALEA